MPRDDEELAREVRSLAERIADLEEDRDRLKGMPEAVAEIKGMVTALSGMVQSGFKSVGEGVDKAAGVKTAITFAAVVIVPILVAIIGGYFAFKSAQPK